VEEDAEEGAGEDDGVGAQRGELHGVRSVLWRARAIA
jgi:hypothetical protein